MTDPEVRLGEIRQRLNSYQEILAAELAVGGEDAVDLREQVFFGKAARPATRLIQHAPEDIQWLLLAVDRLQANTRMWMQQVEQLKDMLKRLEWAGDGQHGAYCLGCGSLKEAVVASIGGTGHDPECWLWLAIRTA